MRSIGECRVDDARLFEQVERVRVARRRAELQREAGANVMFPNRPSSSHTCIVAWGPAMLTARSTVPEISISSVLPATRDAPARVSQ